MASLPPIDMKMLDSPPKKKGEEDFELRFMLEAARDELKTANERHSREMSDLESRYKQQLEALQAVKTVGTELDDMMRMVQCESLALHTLCRVMTRAIEVSQHGLMRMAVRSWAAAWNSAARHTQRYYLGSRLLVFISRRCAMSRMKDAIWNIATGVMADRLDRLETLRHEDDAVHRQVVDDAAVRTERTISKLRREKKELQDALVKQRNNSKELAASTEPSSVPYGEWLREQTISEDEWLKADTTDEDVTRKKGDPNQMVVLSGLRQASARWISGKPSKVKDVLSEPTLDKVARVAWPPTSLQGIGGSVAWSVGSASSPRLSLVPPSGLKGQEGREHAVFHRGTGAGVGVAVGGAGGVAALA